MDVFSLRDRVIQDYADYVRSFVQVPRLLKRAPEKVTATKLTKLGYLDKKP